LAASIAALPETPGIYSFTVRGNAPHLSSSKSLKRRLKRLLVPSYTASPNDGSPPAAKFVLFGQFRENVDRVDCWFTASRLETSLLMYELARSYYPKEYLKRLRLRLPWFVGTDSADPFPRLEIVNRPSAKSTAVYGPFLSRDLAQRYEQEVLGLFQLRRCTEVLAPHAGHPGCIYGEMNQCLRPCQCAVTPQEYASEAERVSEFLASNGKSAVATLSAARQRASAELDFEQAAQIHKRLERVAAAAACRDQAITAVDKFNGIALTRGFGNRQFRLWPMLTGYWQDPVNIDIPLEEAHAKPLDHEIRESLTPALSVVHTEGHRAEHLALFSRWYYSSWRDGHWFPFRALPDLNYRRLVREMSNLAKTAGPC